MQVQTNATVYNVIDNSFIGQDGQPVKSYKLEMGVFGEKSIAVGIDEQLYEQLRETVTAPIPNVPIVLELSQYGNKLGVRCVQVG